MLTQEDDVDAHALAAKGWTISAIARHLGHDRKTIRAYLTGGRTAGVRAPAGGDAFERFVDYTRERLREDPHLWATTLYDELVGLGFEQSYQTLTRQIRERGLRPPCETCRPAKQRPVAIIEHPPGGGVSRERCNWSWRLLVVGGEESVAERDGEGVEGGPPAVHPAVRSASGGVEAIVR
jgi:transposase